jgi:Reverse transcriptase (RNA-dependent DNA polymerase)
MREWGEKVWVRIEGGNKLGGHVHEGRWLGLDERSKGIHVYWPDTKTVSIEQNVYVDKTSASHFEGENSEGFIKTNPDLPGNCIPPKTPSSSPNYMPFAQPSNADIPHALEPIEPHSDEDPPETCPKHIQKPTQCIKDILEGVAESSKLPLGVQLPTQPQDNEDIPVEESETVLEGEGLSDWMMVVDEYALAAEISKAEALEPRNLAEAKARPDWPLWEKAIQEEISVLKAAGTWELVDAPKGVNIVGLKWVFRAKKDAAGIVVCYKAHLVAQGFSQVPGVDYFDMFAPVAHLSSIRAVLSIAAVNDYEIHQIDIKGAYLNGILTSNETIFMKQPLLQSDFLRI